MKPWKPLVVATIAALLLTCSNVAVAGPLRDAAVQKAMAMQAQAQQTVRYTSTGMVTTGFLLTFAGVYAAYHFSEKRKEANEARGCTNRDYAVEICEEGLTDAEMWTSISLMVAGLAIGSAGFNRERPANPSRTLAVSPSREGVKVRVGFGF